MWINAGWFVLYLNPSKATSQLNIFTHRSSPWALQASQSQRSEEVCCSSLQLHIDLSETSLVQLITLFLEREREWGGVGGGGNNNKPEGRKGPVFVWVIHFNCWVTVLEEKLMADICRNWVYCFCFVALIDVAMRKNDWEASEGGREDGGEGGG